jgi:hypothetical protein
MRTYRLLTDAQIFRGCVDLLSRQRGYAVFTPFTARASLAAIRGDRSQARSSGYNSMRKIPLHMGNSPIYAQNRLCVQMGILPIWNGAFSVELIAFLALELRRNSATMPSQNQLSSNCWRSN